MNRDKENLELKAFLYTILAESVYAIMCLLSFMLLVGIIESKPAAETPSPKPSYVVSTEAPSENKDRYTIMLYMLGSNLETDSGLATENLERLGDVPYSEEVNVVIQAGGALTWHNPTMRDGRTGRYVLNEGKVDTIESLGKVSMVDPDTLTEFIDWAAQNYPAEHYVLLLWDHGGGIPMGFGYDELYPYDDMSAYEIGRAIGNSKVHPEIVLFDACLMSTVEVAYSLAGVADYMIASEETMYATYTFLDDIVLLTVQYPEKTPAEIARTVIDTYIEEVDADNGLDLVPTNLSVIDLSQMENVKTALDTYMDNCKDCLYTGDLRNYLQARNNCGGFPDADTVDIVSFAKNYAVDGAEALISAVNDAVLYTRGNITYAHGLAMYAPSIDYMDEYSDAGRDLFLNLGEENEVAFYDAMYSAMINYNRGNVADNRTDWYDADAASSYDDYGNYSNTFVDAEYSEDKEDVLIVPYTKRGNRYVLELDDSDWEIIDTIETNAGFYLEGDDSWVVVSIGSDNIWTLDRDESSIDLSFPETWLCMDGQIVEYVVLDEYSDDDGNWSTFGAVLAALNGDYSTLIYIVPYWSSDNPDPIILGYYRLDPDTLEYKDGDSYLYPLLPGDSFEFVYEVYETEYDEDEGEENKYTIGPEHIVTDDGLLVYYDYASNFRDLFEDEELIGYSWITITDIYGNVYETEVLFEDD